MMRGYYGLGLLVCMMMSATQSMERERKIAAHFPLISSKGSATRRLFSENILDQHILATAKGGTFHMGCTTQHCMHEESLRRDIRARNSSLTDEALRDHIKNMCHWDRVHCLSVLCMSQRLSRLVQSIIHARGNIEFSHAASGYTPLHSAVRWFQTRYSPYDMMPHACTQALLQQRASINAPDSVGRTPLVTTLVNTRSTNPLQWVEYLLDHSADVNSAIPGDAVPYSFGGDDTFNKRSDKRTLVPFYIATRRAWRSSEFGKIVSALLEAKANVAWAEQHGRPLIDRLVEDHLIRDSDAGIAVRKEYKQSLTPLLRAYPPVLSELVIAYMIGDTGFHTEEERDDLRRRVLIYDIDKMLLPKITRSKR